MQDQAQPIEPAQAPELRDYVDVLYRRRWAFLVPVALFVTMGVIIAFVLPATYRSEATLLIQRQTIPQNVIPTTVNAYVQEQIQQIRERIVSQENLLELAKELSYMPELVESNPRELALRMRRAIEIEMIDINASDPDRAGQRRATIAFTVAFSADNPETAQRMTEALTKMYQRFHKQARSSSATDVTIFLEAESAKLADEISGLEQKLAAFKQGELRQLPELMNMNLNLFERTEQDIVSSRDRIRSLEDQINVANAELSLTEPYTALRDEDGRVLQSATERLGALTSEYLRATARYSASHPRVTRLQREIQVLANQAGTSARADELMQSLIRQQEELRTAKQRYSSTHPTVTKLEQSIAALQAGFRSALLPADSTVATPSAQQPTNPRYVALQTQVQMLGANLVAEQNRLSELEAQRDEYEKRLFNTPVVERDFKTLSRDYENARSKYAELRDKLIEANLAEQLEQGQNAERFILASPAYQPTSPESPNRLGIILITTLLGLMAGFGAMTMMEYLDRSIRDARAIAKALGAEPFAVIPQFQS